MKLGLKNIKAITSSAYSVEAPADYWNERGYSKYDGYRPATRRVFCHAERSLTVHRCRELIMDGVAQEES